MNASLLTNIKTHRGAQELLAGARDDQARRCRMRLKIVENLRFDLHERLRDVQVCKYSKPCSLKIGLE